ncbi:MAG: CDP-alcohol phosphatidyltransferase family protein [Planctomycetaceae bacterium]
MSASTAKKTGERKPETDYTDRFLTIPNVLCVIRIVGSGFLIGLAVYEHYVWFVGLYFFLSLTDWVDGKIARYLNQQSEIGAKLDSAADSVLYISLLIGGGILLGDVLLQHWPWMLMAFLSYVAHVGYGFWKFGKKPVYHTLGAKTSWFLGTVGTLCILGDIAVWPLFVAMVAVMLTNLESIAITRKLTKWQADIPSLYHLWRRQHWNG